MAASPAGDRAHGGGFISHLGNYRFGGFQQFGHAPFAPLMAAELCVALPYAELMNMRPSSHIHHTGKNRGW